MPRIRDVFQQAVVNARLANGLSQADLAARIGTTQSAIARLESGAVSPSIATLRRLADTLGITFEIRPASGLTSRPAQGPGLTLEDLRSRREEILSIAAARGARNVRVFGSVARGQAGPESDVDFLVELEPNRTVLDVSELILDLEEALGRRVDVVQVRWRSPIAEQIEREAVPL